MLRITLQNQSLYVLVWYGMVTMVRNNEAKQIIRLFSINLTKPVTDRFVLKNARIRNAIKVNRADARNLNLKGVSILDSIYTLIGRLHET